MAYIAADKNGNIHIFSEKPVRHNPNIGILCFWTYWLDKRVKYISKINKRICKDILGKVITWNDEPKLI